MDETTPTVTLRLTDEQIEDARELIKIVRDALDNSYSHTVLCCHVGHDEVDALEAKINKAVLESMITS